VTVVLEVDQPELPSQAVSPLSVSSEQTYATSPQDPSEEPIPVLSPLSPLQSKSIQTTTVSTSPLLTPVAAPVVNSNPLHCRLCLADSCDDITASMCGHIFCNRFAISAHDQPSRPLTFDFFWQMYY
jgi:hypothetical protein